MWLAKQNKKTPNSKQKIHTPFTRKIADANAVLKAVVTRPRVHVVPVRKEDTSPIVHEDTFANTQGYASSLLPLNPKVCFFEELTWLQVVSNLVNVGTVAYR